MIKALLTALTVMMPLAAGAAPVAYQLEPQKSEVGFVFTLNGSAARGEMPVTASDIRIDLAALQRSSIDVSVDVTRARTGFFFATEALKGRSVLDANNHSTIRFRSTRIRLNGAGRLSDGARIDGMLTMRGVTRPVTLSAGLFRQAGTEAGDLSRLSFRIKGQLSRSAFGASGYANLVEDMVTLDITARVRR